MCPLQILAAYDTINMTVAAYSPVAGDNTLYYTQLFTAVLDQPAITNVSVWPTSAGNVYALYSTITITFGIVNATANDHKGDFRVSIIVKYVQHARAWP